MTDEDHGGSMTETLQQTIDRLANNLKAEAKYRLSERTLQDVIEGPPRSSGLYDPIAEQLRMWAAIHDTTFEHLCSSISAAADRTEKSRLKMRVVVVEIGVPDNG